MLHFSYEIRLPTSIHTVDQTGGVFEIRPHKDFVPAKGRDRILSLKLLADLPVPPTAPASTSSHSSSEPSSDPPRNAYDFMRRRIDVTGDPAIKKWYASIRVGNFAAIEQSPLCVRSPSTWQRSAPNPWSGYRQPQ